MILRILSLILFANVSIARTYYISTTGNDARNDGSIDRSWKTIGRANPIKLVSGDCVLLEGDAAFQGNLVLAPPDQSSETTEIRIGSFGRGMATLLAGNGSGILSTNISKLTVENLIIQGSGSVTNSGFGFLCDNTSVSTNACGHTE